MKREITPEMIRESTIAHLETLAGFGVKHAPRGRKVVPAATVSISDRPEPAPKTPTSVTAVSPSPVAFAPSQSPAAPTKSGFYNLPADPQQLAALGSLQDLAAYVGPCERCKLCKQRKNVVFGVGDPTADLMFVGEGPGADEDEQGIPFVGRAGQLLTKMIQAMGLSREQVYIGNVVKCRPPENRNPEPDEITSCIPFLKRQIELVKPRAIVCLGRIATQALLNTQIPISKLRGRFQDYAGIQVMPTYHPAFLLRSPDMKKFAWDDLQQVMKFLGKSQ